MSDLLFAIWFFLPAGLANGAPVIANKIPILNQWTTPLDFGKSWRGKRILGTHKTWRGLVVGGLTGGITSVITYWIYPEAINYVSIAAFAPVVNMFIVGTSLGVGALVGDAVESFFKRQSGVKPGDTWFPFDQIDYIIGGLIFATPFVILNWRMNLLILVTWFGLHIISSYLSYLAGLKEKPI